MEHVGNIIGVEIDSLVIIAPKRSELTITDFLAIESKFIVSDTADIDCRISKLFRQIEVCAENDAARCH